MLRFKSCHGGQCCWWLPVSRRQCQWGQSQELDRQIAPEVVGYLRVTWACAVTLSCLRECRLWCSTVAFLRSLSHLPSTSQVCLCCQHLQAKVSVRRVLIKKSDDHTAKMILNVFLAHELPCTFWGRMLNCLNCVLSRVVDLLICFASVAAPANFFLRGWVFFPLTTSVP